jgi:serine/threonine-protein kinase
MAPGVTIRGYRLGRVLGEGGSGLVYEATHTAIGRRVAIKVLAPDRAEDPELVSRFLNEAKIVNEIRHPNIIDVLDYIEIKRPRRVALVMELLEGRSLAAVLEDGPLTLKRAVNVCLQLADALHAVHAKGVIHRDLKPDNVIVLGGPDSDLSTVPSVKLLDFGIAKYLADSVAHRTVTGSVWGTPEYLAPEQGSAEPVSPATDLYALAEIFHEMITGRRIFSGAATTEVLSAKLSFRPETIELPAELEDRERIRALLSASLALEPARRGATCLRSRIRTRLSSLSPRR